MMQTKAILFFAALDRIAFRKVECLSFLDAKNIRNGDEKSTPLVKREEKPFYGSTEIGPFW
jgi:hypothetical protein